MKTFLAIVAMLAAGVAFAAGEAPSPAMPSIKGEVVEVKDVEAYTYLRLKTAEGEIWAAVNRAPVKKGALVTIENATVMNDFESKTLNRKFDRIVFGKLAGTPAAATAAPGGDMAAFHSGLPKPGDIGDVKVAKASGPEARTVAEIVGKKAELKDKSVVVRGKVVKFTPEILGKNWIHLRDGTGTEADKSNDILVTTKGQAQVGDVVVAKGVVRTDVDLGSGYSYKVMVDEATLSK